MTGLELLAWAAGPLLIAIVVACWPRRATLTAPVGTTTPDYRHAGGDPALPIPEDGAELNYHHPLGHPVRVVRQVPIAVGPDGRCSRYSAAAVAWVTCREDDQMDILLALEARERIRMEETQVDLSASTGWASVAWVSDGRQWKRI